MSTDSKEGKELHLGEKFKRQLNFLPPSAIKKDWTSGCTPESIFAPLPLKDTRTFCRILGKTVPKKQWRQYRLCLRLAAIVASSATTPVPILQSIHSIKLQHHFPPHELQYFWFSLQSSQDPTSYPFNLKSLLSESHQKKIQDLLSSSQQPRFLPAPEQPPSAEQQLPLAEHQLPSAEHQHTEKLQVILCPTLGSSKSSDQKEESHPSTCTGNSMLVTSGPFSR